ncbi:phosphoribosylglycinamide formyltransferase [Mycolicibacterium novocastrense]|uniref:formate-dependent phosphoribosylglycinamide formyltransferase n=1 Tax=Mycolicibacterium novocastrense TaxID=59813 RepID=UPI00074AE06F|nr:formate-dependent phosphoribosylglycinamide formyltransferase [Mycolicibacterium novocastrense]KUH64118.1 phosphoribosylglycinamide formyltransferase [Mycolicibacterium novocastrense]KUH69083.1 phosphoribosylglycinamide formyltransferase [Mycolicibacterium novocastrense]KUH69279.1 phosphoribosylglycinamide formyltransferase [Mycolicibacterium novocastrense]
MTDTPQTAVDPGDPVTDPEPVAGTPGAASVMLLGSGELSRELALAFQRLGAEVIAVDRYADAPAHGVADRPVVAKMNDAEELTALIEKENPRFVVAEGGVIAADALIAVAERGVAEVFPTPRSTRLSLDREGLRRLAADELGLPTAPFWFAGSTEELGAVAQHAGFPLVVKPIASAAGEGESVLVRAEDVEPAWQRAVAAGRIPHNRVMVESVVEVDFEVTLLTIRTVGPTGPAVHFCEPIGHRQPDGDVLESWQPQRLTPTALDSAKSIAARIVNSLGGRGVFGVELLVRGDEVYFDHVRPRTHDSGLVTLRSQRLSEFELHARAILGLPVDTIMISPAAAEIVYAGAEARPASGQDPQAVLAEALAVAESDVALFNRPDETEDRRRLAVALATAPDPIVARDRARRVTAALRRLW